MSNITEPSANAIFFDIVDAQGQQFQAHLDLHMVVDFWAWQLCYKRANETRWTPLSPSSDPAGNFIVSYGDKVDVDKKFDTVDKCEAEIMRICAGFTRAIEAVFGKPGVVAPSGKTGLEGLVEILKTRVTAQDNVLSVKPR